MEESPSGLAAKQMVDSSRIGAFPALVLLLTVPLATFISASFPVNGLPELASGSNRLSLGGLALVWEQLAVAVAMVFVFYEIGKRIDFASHYRLLATLAFAGALHRKPPGLLSLHGQLAWRVCVAIRVRLRSEFRSARAKLDHRTADVGRRCFHDSACRTVPRGTSGSSVSRFRTRRRIRLPTAKFAFYSLSSRVPS